MTSIAELDKYISGALDTIPAQTDAFDREVLVNTEENLPQFFAADNVGLNWAIFPKHIFDFHAKELALD